MGLSLLLPGSRVSALLVQGSDPIAMVLRPEGLNLGVVHIPAVELLGNSDKRFRTTHLDKLINGGMAKWYFDGIENNMMIN